MFTSRFLFLFFILFFDTIMNNNHNNNNIFSTTSFVSAELLTDYLADPVDNRPEGRYRFSMFCFQWQQDYYGYLEPAVGILGGTSNADTFSADFHLYLPERGVWFEKNDNRASYDPRHSMVTQPLYIPGFDSADLLTFGGVVSDPDIGTTIVDDPLLKYMDPQDPEFPEDLSWFDPATFDDYPSARTRAASFVIANNMYIFGGLAADGVIKGDLWRFTDELGYYTWSLVYSPVEEEDYGSYYEDFGGSSAADEYGGGSFTGYDSPDYYGSYSNSYYGSYSSYSYGGSSSSSFGGFAGGRRDAILQEENEIDNNHNNNNDKKKKQRHDFHNSEDELVFFEKVYEQNHRVRQNRNADIQSTSGSGFVSDKILFRFGACCASLSVPDGPASSSGGSGTDQYSLCFGGSGKSGDSRSVLKYKHEDWSWEELLITNPNEGPKPVRDASCTYNVVEQKFIVFGGYDSRTGAASSDTKIYFLSISNLLGPGEATWNSTKKQANFDPVFGHAMCTTPMNNKTYLFGGKSTFTTNATLFELDWADDATNARFTVATKPLVTLPPERAYHIAAGTGTSFYVGFGRKKNSMHLDFWKFDLITDSWKQISQTAVSARFGVSSAVFGSVIFLFGGRSSLKGTVCYSDLVAFESAKEEFSVIDATLNAPSARAFHVSFVSNNLVVIGLGQDSNGVLLDDWKAFSPVTQTWRVLQLEGDKISARSGASSVQSFNETHSLIGLGFNAVGLNDWYFVTVNNNRIISTKIQLQNTLAPRITRRSFASVAGRGRHVLVCGGMQTATLASPPDGRCYQIDVKSGQVGLTSNTTAPVGVVAAPSVYVRDSIFTFGGQIISDPTVSSVYYKRVVRVRPNATCNVSTSSSSSSSSILDDTSCSLCGFGSSGLNCEFTEPGFYTNFAGETIPCPKGTFSTVRGASSSSTCIPCGFQTFGNVTGLSRCFNCSNTSYCPVGSSEEIQSSSSRAMLLRSSLPLSGIITERNPGAYESPPLPWFPVGVVAGAAISLALLVAFVLYINYKFYKRRLSYYFPDDVAENLNKIFISYSKNGSEMNLSQMILVFTALNFDISPSILERAFLDQVEDTGRLTLRKDDFKKAVMDLIRVGLLPPFRGSRAEKEGAELDICCSSFGGIRLSSFDTFRAEHVPPALGEARRVIQTPYGGVLTLILLVAEIILILAILVNFLYANVTEAKAIVPYPIVQSAFGTSIGEAKSNIQVKIGITGPIRESQRYGPSDSSVTKAQKVCLDIATGACNNETRVTATGVTIPFPENERFDCSFDIATSQCFVTWRCQNCTVISSAELLYTFSSPQSANRIDCEIQTSSGIHEPEQAWTGQLQIASGPLLHSSIHAAVSPSKPELVFSGFPATQFHFGLSPTYFESVELVHVIVPSENPVLDTGYHLRPDANPTKGNMISPQFFGTYYDAPVKVLLKTDSEIMYVRRQFIQSLIDLVSSLLGAISGVVGVFLAVVNFIDEQDSEEVTLDDENNDENDNKNSNNNDEEDKTNKKKKTKKLMKLPGQEEGDYDLKEEVSFSATEEDTFRVLPLVSLGVSVDLALKYQRVMRAHLQNELPPASAEKFDLETHRKEVKEKRAPISLDGVEEIEVDVEDIERDKHGGKGKVMGAKKYLQGEDKGRNQDNDESFTPQVIHVETKRGGDDNENENAEDGIEMHEKYSPRNNDNNDEGIENRNKYSNDAV